ncbi:DUF5131 family protein [Methylobacterium sp. NPDC080182]|uniref:DUF5131 family protein n=1 Tax=Methylobacterium sp. NPDC080182 TaxID=3390590 RepID=UPI003D04973F
MAISSSIEWTDATWNPVAGCNIVSPGCTNCYAMRMAARLQIMGQEKYAGTTRKSGARHVWTGKIVLDRKSLDVPRQWKRGRRIFVNSMSDLFHEDVPVEYIRDVFRVMSETERHTYQILTKRAERLAAVSDSLRWPSNVWMGVSVESEEYVHRIDELRASGARVKFLSLEPLLGPLPELNLTGIDWVIVGGESGPAARPIDPNWVREIRDRCLDANVPFHFKQWGGKVKSTTGRTLDGRTWDQWPRQAEGQTAI